MDFRERQLFEVEMALAFNPRYFNTSPERANLIKSIRTDNEDDQIPPRWKEDRKWQKQ